jgi:protein DJ-1
MEVVIVVDLLRRAGIEVTLAGLDGGAGVECSRKVQIIPDTSLGDAQGPFDLIVLPGGIEGSERLASDSRVGELLREQVERGGEVAAICAAPKTLVIHGVGHGMALTSHPAVRTEVEELGDYRESSVVEDGPIVTSRGPGTAFEFSLTLIKRLLGERKVAEVRLPLML